MPSASLRQLPAVDRMLQDPDAARLIADYGRPLTVNALRQALARARQALQAGEANLPAADALLADARSILQDWLTPTLRRVINATGVIVHTNLGRAPLSEAAISAVQAVAAGYSTLEFDLGTGRRGSRSQHAEALLSQITGADSALVVNNNAGAVLLALSALAGPDEAWPRGREVIISRSQLVEIGGGFRIPDVMAQSGARLVEVGTTNRTHLHDYERAVNDASSLIMRVHRSNFALIGFTAEPSLAELVALGHSRGLLVLDDVGSGALIDTVQFGLAPEPVVQHSLAAGADLVLFSGDKLLGGPQAGILAGRSAVIDRLRRHPLARALRADKLCLAALSATLIHYLKGEALECVPVWQMIGMPVAAVEERARRWASALSQAGRPAGVVEGRSAIGGGSLPGETLPSCLLALETSLPDQLAARLRQRAIPIIVRIEDNRVLIDPRTVLPRDEEELLQALTSLTPTPGDET